MFQDEGLVSSEQRIREWKYYEGVQLPALKKELLILLTGLEFIPESKVEHEGDKTNYSNQNQKTFSIHVVVTLYLSAIN